MLWNQLGVEMKKKYIKRSINDNNWENYRDEETFKKTYRTETMKLNLFSVRLIYVDLLKDVPFGFLDF